MVFFLFVLIHTVAAAQVYELPLKERIAQADLIFEGRFISKESFPNEERNNIYTLNRIEVYKIFKGQVRYDTVIVVTEGGMVDGKMVLADHTLKLSAGNTGLFFVKRAEGKFNTAQACYSPFAGPQSFIEYDLIDKIASDGFKVYKNIPKCLYKVIRKKTKQSYVEIKPFDINTSGTPVK